jgi:hypothetical protein
MRLQIRLASLAAMLGSGGAIAADMLPLKQGIYVPVGRACKGASNSEMVNYWGGKSSIGASQGECTIKTIARKGNVFILKDQCRDIQSGKVIAGSATVLEIANPTSFRMSGTA